MCFNGVVKCIFTCSQRKSEGGLRVTFFDLDWNVLPFTRHYPKSDIPIQKPRNYQKMIEIAQTLSKEFEFVRVDLYEIEGKVFFSELTFYPGNGFEEFIPEIYDYTLGEWIILKDS